MHKTIKPIDVLVGEANDGHAEMVETSLRESGIVNNLYRGRDGAETCALIRDAWRGCEDATDTPSLIFLDCGLPRVGGVGVLRALRNDLHYSRIPIIMMTAKDSRRQAEQCRRFGCDAYVTKWAVFLGLPGLVRIIRFLAGRAIWDASRRLAAAGSDGRGAGTLDLGSMSDVARTYRHRQERIGKDAKNEPATP